MVDVPEGSEIQFRSARFAGVDVLVREGQAHSDFQAEVQKREHELALQKNEYDRPSLEKKLDVDAINFPATILYYGRTKPMTMIKYGKPVPGTEEGISIEGYGIKDKVSYLFRAIDLGSPRGDNNVLDLVNRFEARSNSSIPTQPGFCIDSGFVHDPTPADDNESVAMFASPKGHPDIAIRLDTSINMTQLEESLLSRDANNRLKKDHASRFTHFRKGARNLNGIPGEEVLSKVKEFNGTSVHGFMWVGVGKMNDVLAPTLTLELETGKGAPGEPVNSSMSDEEVLQLWESISSSLKVRPTSNQTDQKSSTLVSTV